MERRSFAKTCRAALLDELALAGLAPTCPDGTARLELGADVAYVWCEDADLPVVRAVVAAHDPTAADAATAARALAAQPLLLSTTGTKPARAATVDQVFLDISAGIDKAVTWTRKLGQSDWLRALNIAPVQDMAATADSRAATAATTASAAQTTANSAAAAVATIQNRITRVGEVTFTALTLLGTKVADIRFKAAFPVGTAYTVVPQRIAGANIGPAQMTIGDIPGVSRLSGFRLTVAPGLIATTVTIAYLAIPTTEDAASATIVQG